MNVPNAQGAQLPECAGLKYPLLHGVHSVSPADDEYPGGHSSQLVAPEMLLNVPAGHKTQVDEPLSSEYCPGLHGVQLEVYPNQENVPAGHSSQPVAPGVSLNVPGMHMAHDFEPVMLV